jgi:Tol biopolymer transport system component
VRRVLMAAAVAGLALAGAAPAGAVFPGANGRIAYVSPDGAGGSTLHTVLPSGHGDMVIASGEFGLDGPVWSPTGRRLAFDTYNSDYLSDVFTARQDGSDLRRLTNYSDSTIAFAGQPSYSPGGGRIAFHSWVYHDVNRIKTTRNDGSDTREIAHDYPRRGVGAPVWSPGGEIAFFVGGAPDKLPSIWAMRLDGTDKHHLVDLGKAGGLGPFYAPSGRKFLFVRYLNASADRRTLLANANGRNVRRPPCAAALEQMRVIDSYSPDGKWVLGAEVDSRGNYTLVRLLLRSCRSEFVADGGSSADWQAAPPPPAP